MMKETDIFNDTSLQNDIQDLVAIEQAMLRKKYPLPNLDEELKKIVEEETPTQEWLEDNKLGTNRELADNKEKVALRPLLKTISSAAIGAAAMLALVFAWNWLKSNHLQSSHPIAMNMASDSGMATIQTSDGEMITLTLSDGTEVKLNSNSKLSYPHQFKGKERIIQLSGEAFFKVKHDSQRPFIVDAGGILTKDLGTSFNIRAYSEHDCKVTLVEGKVAVLSKEKDAKPVVLAPGEQFSTLQGSTNQVQMVDTEETTAWADGVLYYHDKTLEYIVSDIAAHYQLTADFRNKQAMDKHLDFSIEKNGSINNAISLLNDLGVAKISLKNKQIIID